MSIILHRFVNPVRLLILAGLLGGGLFVAALPPAAAQEEAGPSDVPATLPADEPSSDRTSALLSSITVFVLAIFVGFEVITKVPPTLHTPLMSGSNAISGITLVGSVLAAGVGNALVAACLGFLAVMLATVNVVGGFLVTERMLSMFKKKS